MRCVHALVLCVYEYSHNRLGNLPTGIGSTVRRLLPAARSITPVLLESSLSTLIIAATICSDRCLCQVMRVSVETGHISLIVRQNGQVCHQLCHALQR